MSISKRQKQILAEDAAYVVRFNSGQEADSALFGVSMSLQMTIFPYHDYGRNGRGHNVTLHHVYHQADGSERFDRAEFSSTCSYEAAAVSRAQEIARLLVDLGAPRDLVRVRHFWPTMQLAGAEVLP